MIVNTNLIDRTFARIGSALAGTVASFQSPSPVAVQKTPAPPPTDRAEIPRHPFYIGNRPRLATCGGVAWFHGDHLATVNLLGNAVHTYDFERRSKTLVLRQSLVHMTGLMLPENLAFSPDGSLLAVTNSVDSTVNVYRTDRASHAIDPTPAVSIKPSEPVSPHGVTFSPCSTMLLYSTVEEPGSLRLFRLIRGKDGRVEVHMIQELSNRSSPLRPKGVAFSPDARFIALAYGSNAETSPGEDKSGFLAIHAFDNEKGCDRDPIHTVGDRLGVRCAEDINFFPDGRHLAVTDQATGTAMVVEFDRSSGTIGKKKLSIRNPRGRLSFPHGNGVSEDGRFLAVANYGEDELTIYEVPL